MNEQVPDRENAPMSRAALGRDAGVAPATLKLWTDRKDNPLVTVAAPDGRHLYTWSHLRDFCMANPTLTAAQRALRRYRELFIDPPGGPTPPVSNVGAGPLARSRTASSEAVAGNGVTLRSVLEDLKTQVLDYGEVVTAATKLAQDAGRVQAGLLARVELMELAVAGTSDE